MCSNHFSSNDIEIKGKRKLVKSGRFPSIFPNNGTDQNYLQAKDDVTARSNEVPYEPIENDDVTENFGIVTADASDQSDTRSNDEQLICVDDNGANDTNASDDVFIQSDQESDYDSEYLTHDTQYEVDTLVQDEMST